MNMLTCENRVPCFVSASMWIAERPLRDVSDVSGVGNVCYFMPSVPGSPGRNGLVN